MVLWFINQLYNGFSWSEPATASGRVYLNFLDVSFTKAILSEAPSVHQPTHIHSGGWTADFVTINVRFLSVVVLLFPPQPEAMALSHALRCAM
ncbi:hypothetical protein RHMOL_Rhmol07G0135900 [Rhododendron molle]|uniref:Uncharacterized protein n=1 Tax=Rhododendron molle TaxID=49168 RepID=A0ACC0N1A5_RHOML|nr:hypothetical protein RHMOL_Rhmol07G0135900 [Rhododendron molle]